MDELLKNKINQNDLSLLKEEKKIFSSKKVHSFNKVKFEIYGEEMIEKVVKASGNSGRIYLPPDWVGCCVKVVRVE